MLWSSHTLMVLYDSLICAALSLSAAADAYQASTRLYDVFTAELLEEEPIIGARPPAVGTNGSRNIDPTMDVAIRVRNGQFTWDAAPAPLQAEGTKKSGKGGGKDKKSAAARVENKPGGAEKQADEEKIFKLKDINFEIPNAKVRAQSFILQLLLSSAALRRFLFVI